MFVMLQMGVDHGANREKAYLYEALSDSIPSHGQSGARPPPRQLSRKALQIFAGALSERGEAGFPGTISLYGGPSQEFYCAHMKGGDPP